MSLTNYILGAAAAAGLAAGTAKADTIYSMGQPASTPSFYSMVETGNTSDNYLTFLVRNEAPNHPGYSLGRIDIPFPGLTSLDDIFIDKNWSISYNNNMLIFLSPSSATNLQPGEAFEWGAGTTYSNRALQEVIFQPQSGDYMTGQVNLPAVPEPNTIVGLTIGAGMLGMRRRR